MSVARRWVFPILRIVIFAAIAAALIKLAFFAGPVDADGPEFPTGEIVDPQVPVAIGTIRNDVVLQGSVNPDAPIAVKATLNGEVRKISVAAGQWVDAGAEMMQIRGTNEDGTPRWSIVKAPAAGVLSAFSILVGQGVSVGQDVGQIAPPGFNVTAPLAPEDRYRLLELPAHAEVSVNGGPAPFACTGLTISTTSAGTGGGDGGGDPGTGGSSTSVRCAVPGDVRVFPGLTATVTIAGGIAENVLTVPTTAVEGAAQSGIVYLVGPDGEPEPREVTLGLNDGVSVEITGGLEEGDLVFQFVPGAPADPGMQPGGPVIIEGRGG